MSVVVPLSPVEKNDLYDVYLSCAGQRVRCGLAHNLYCGLIKEGYSVFLDDVQIGPGEDINEKIDKAIYNSRVFVPIFSDEYPISVDTLNQLEKIRYLCKASSRHTMFPLYMDAVDRTVVGEQLGKYAEAFAEHDRLNVFREQKMKAWQGALAEAAGIKGLSRNAFGMETDFINEVVGVVTAELKPTVLVVNPPSTFYIPSFFRWGSSSKGGHGQARALVGKV